MRASLGWLFLVPFLLLSFLAPGTMLSPGQDGGTVVVLCTGEGPLEMVLADDGSYHPAGSQPDHGHDPVDVCDWSIHAQAAMPDLDAQTGDFVRAELPAEPFVNVPQHARRLAVLAPSARGPPAITT